MNMPTTAPNADPTELAKFSALAQSWWDPNGPSKPLHDLNPLRLRYVERIADLACAGPASAGRDQKLVLDVGCGGGILSESMARAGAQVLGIDLAQSVLDVAELHALEGRIEVKYRAVAAEDLALERPATFDVVTCMEMLEHVPEPASSLAALAKLVKPGGDVIVSTLNRNPRAFAVAIIGAEYLARVLPRGTHDYLKFIRPSELARWGREAGLDLMDLTGIAYNPFTRAFRLSPDTGVNYLAHFRRSAPGTAIPGTAAPNTAATGNAGSGSSAS
jgi:2-polyprenyl-6-hydroxyphenyl methylase / 3-demethylubiquinone-9 3-methyltransferase